MKRIPNPIKRPKDPVKLKEWEANNWKRIDKSVVRYFADRSESSNQNSYKGNSTEES